MPYVCIVELHELLPTITNSLASSFQAPDVFVRFKNLDFYR